MATIFERSASQSAASCLQLFAQRIFLRELGGSRIGRIAHAFDRLHSVRHVLQLFVNLHGEIELRLAFLQRILGPRIHRNIQLFGVSLISFGELHRVLAGQHARSLRRFKQRRRCGSDRRRLHTHSPAGAVQSAMLAAGNRVHQFAILIEDLDLQIAEDVAPFLVIGDLRIRGPTPAAESFVAFGPATLHVKVLDRRPAGKQRRIFRHHFRA